MVRPAFIDLNPVQLKYYPFMISLNKCTESCNLLSPKVCVPKERKGMNVEAFNMWQKIFQVIVNANLLVWHVIQIKKGTIKHIYVNVKIIISAKKL